MKLVEEVRLFRELREGLDDDLGHSRPPASEADGEILVEELKKKRATMEFMMTVVPLTEYINLTLNNVCSHEYCSLGTYSQN